MGSTFYVVSGGGSHSLVGREFGSEVIELSVWLAIYTVRMGCRLGLLYQMRRPTITNPIPRIPAMGTRTMISIILTVVKVVEGLVWLGYRVIDGNSWVTRVGSDVGFELG